VQKSITTALVSSHHDYCNSLLVGFANRDLTQPTHMAQNSLTRAIIKISQVSKYYTNIMALITPAAIKKINLLKNLANQPIYLLLVGFSSGYSTIYTFSIIVICNWTLSRGDIILTLLCFVCTPQFYLHVVLRPWPSKLLAPINHEGMASVAWRGVRTVRRPRASSMGGIQGTSFRKKIL